MRVLPVKEAFDQLHKRLKHAVAGDFEQPLVKAHIRLDRIGDRLRFVGLPAARVGQFEELPVILIGHALPDQIEHADLERETRIEQFLFGKARKRHLEPEILDQPPVVERRDRRSAARRGVEHAEKLQPVDRLADRHAAHVEPVRKLDLPRQLVADLHIAFDRRLQQAVGKHGAHGFRHDITLPVFGFICLTIIIIPKTT